MKTQISLQLNIELSPKLSTPKLSILEKNKIQKIIMKEINDFLYTKIPDLGLKTRSLEPGFWYNIDITIVK